MRKILSLLFLLAMPALVFSGGSAEEVEPEVPREVTRESPMLTPRVEAGELLPLDQRLPDNPRGRYVRRNR